MARARNIKPGLYKNEDLAECSIWARFIFPGLWMLADREGRLEDRPKRIKGELLPFDLQDTEPLLRELETHGFILRYKNSSGLFIQILKFKDHQAPHYSEKPSVIKPHDFPESLPHDEPDKQENSEKTKPIKGGSQPPDILNPSSLNPDTEAKASLSPQAKTPSQKLIEIYHEKCPFLSKVMVFNDPRRKVLHARFKEVSLSEKWGSEKTIEWFTSFYEKVNSSKFLTGRATPGKDGRLFKADWDWIHAPTNFVKICEGKYDGV